MVKPTALIKATKQDYRSRETKKNERGKEKTQENIQFCTYNALSFRSKCPLLVRMFEAMCGYSFHLAFLALFAFLFLFLYAAWPSM